MLGIASLFVCVLIIVVVGVVNNYRALRQTDKPDLNVALLAGLRADIAGLSLRCHKIEVELQSLRHTTACYLDKAGVGPVFLRPAKELTGLQ